MNIARTTQNIWFKLVSLLLATGLALLFGLIGVTGNPIFIGLAVGLVLGLFLLAIPKHTIWLVITLGLATPALLDVAGHGFSRVIWAVSLMALLLWLPGLLNLLNFNAKNQTKNHIQAQFQQKYIPLFIWLALAFTLFAVLSSAMQMHGLGELFGGFKRYFQTFGLLLVLATLVITRKDFDGWLKLLLGIALLQLPFALFERFILVPLRGGLAAGGEATDVVAGTMGANLQGGSPNSIMVLFVLVAFAFVFSRWKVGLMTASRMLLLSFILLLPLVLGETKVVIVLLPLMALVILRKDLVENPVTYVPIFAAMMLLTAALAYLYVYIMLDSDFATAFIGTVNYNIESVGYGTSLLNRTTVMSFWWNLHGWQNPITFLFGHGLGSSYGNGFDAGHIAQTYPNYGINLTTISTLLWDLGLVGLGLYVSIFMAAWMQVSRIWKQTNSVQVKADCMAIQVGIAFTCFFLLYSDSQVNLMVHEIMIAVMLGYAAFLYQEQRRELNLIAKNPNF